MSPTERPLEGAAYDHVALSVADLGMMVAFYTRMGFDEVACMDFAPAPIRLAVMTNARGFSLELTAHAGSNGEPPANPTSAALRRGPFHFALRVDALGPTILAAEVAGARLMDAPRPNSRGTGDYTYLADPEGNLIELVVDPAG